MKKIATTILDSILFVLFFPVWLIAFIVALLVWLAGRINQRPNKN